MVAAKTIRYPTGFASDRLFMINEEPKKDEMNVRRKQVIEKNSETREFLTLCPYTQYGATPKIAANRKR